MRKLSLFSAMLRRRKITNETLARRTGYTVSAIRSWRAGSRYPQPGALKTLAGVLRISQSKLAELLTKDER